MSDEPEGLTAMGPVLDALGVKANLGEGDQITDVVVLAKVANPDDQDGARIAVLFSPGTDPITRIGLYHGAVDAIDGGYELDVDEDDESLSAPERPDCATTIREASEVTTEVRLLALPVEPPVGSEVEARAADGYREGTWTSVDDPRTIAEERHTRRWAPSTIPGARWGQRWSWRALCEWAIRFELELWLTREGPAEEATGG